MANKIESGFESLVFGSRWLQAPIYGGLIIGCVLYAYKFLEELYHIVMEVGMMSESGMMVSLLTLVDMSMVANVLIMVIIGGYSTFVSQLDVDMHEDKPIWLRKIDAGTLKVKLSASLVGVSGVYLLKSFINIKHLEMEDVKWQILLHLVFVISALILAYTEKILHPEHIKGDGFFSDDDHDMHNRSGHGTNENSDSGKKNEDKEFDFLG